MHTLDITRRYSRMRIEPGSTGVYLLDVDTPAAATDLAHIGLVLQCAESLGIASKLLAMTVEYAGQRRQFGRLIGSFQALKHRVADMLIEVEGCRVATRQAAETLDLGGPAAEAVNVAKSFVGRGASYVATNALQLHGGIGFSWEHDLHLYLRRAKVNELLLGTPSEHDELLAQRLTAAAT
jgi:alkylation response protein AidB-like acyl-CoA dehydrogenase